MVPQNTAHVQPDLPRPFGYKTAWLALRTNDLNRAVAHLRLVNSNPANWEEGVEQAHRGAVFVSPPLGVWTLAVGRPLWLLAEPVLAIKPVLEDLSAQFGEAQFFGTHRVVDLHVWGRAVQGHLVRGYGYIGERGETLWDEGESTKEERELGFRFFDERSPEAGQDDYWEREDLTYPDEESVMRLASTWSLDPTTLDQQFSVPGLGLIGQLEAALSSEGLYE